jgi:hypothetical protein
LVPSNKIIKKRGNIESNDINISTNSNDDDEFEIDFDKKSSKINIIVDGVSILDNEQSDLESKVDLSLMESI